MSVVSEKVEHIARPIIEELGYELIEVLYEKKFNGYNLTVVINNEAGITLDDCEKVSKVLDIPLDECDPTNGMPYTFNVSSMGLDRPMKTDKDFQRNLNKEIEVKLFAPLNGKKEFCGNLISFNEKIISLNCNNEILDIERTQIAKAVLAIRF